MSNSLSIPIAVLQTNLPTDAVITDADQDGYLNTGDQISANGQTFAVYYDKEYASIPRLERLVGDLNGYLQRVWSDAAPTLSTHSQRMRDEKKISDLVYLDVTDRTGKTAQNFLGTSV
ncbi:MAG TPA: hypothetical protein VJC18_03410, partial [bacterium]|nr:hypothetical protein [bacterium]